MDAFFYWAALLAYIFAVALAVQSARNLKKIPKAQQALIEWAAQNGLKEIPVEVATQLIKTKSLWGTRYSTSEWFLLLGFSVTSIVAVVRAVSMLWGAT